MNAYAIHGSTEVLKPSQFVHFYEFESESLPVAPFVTGVSAHKQGHHMKKLYYVSYDLIRKKDYPRIEQKLESLGGVRVLLSLWAVQSTMDLAGLYEDLKQFVDSDDRLMVVLSGGSRFKSNVITDPNDAK